MREGKGKMVTVGSMASRGLMENPEYRAGLAETELMGKMVRVELTVKRGRLGSRDKRDEKGFQGWVASRDRREKEVQKAS